jgi:hypothetical protein
MEDALDYRDFLIDEFVNIYNELNSGKIKVCSFACDLEHSRDEEFENLDFLIVDLNFNTYVNLIEVLRQGFGQQEYVPDEISFLLTPLLDDDDNVCLWSAFHELDDPSLNAMFDLESKR